MQNELYHYGTKRHSGRYPYGSGETPYQHESWFLGQVSELRSQGLSDTDIAKHMGMSTSEFRSRRTIEKAQKEAADASNALKLKDKGYSNVEIGRMLGVSEGTIRNYLKPTMQERGNKVETLANVLKEQVDQKTYLDVGKGVEIQLGVKQTQMKPALALLKEQGYKVNWVKVEQATNPGKYTSVQVLTKDDVPWTEVYKNRDKIMSPAGVFFEDNGRTKRNIKPPVSVDSKRIAIKYAEQGGTDKDGVVELRRGVADISLGQNNYAQVRIAVDGTHYIKGMAMYSDDLPKGVDILFNTNKHEGTPMMGPKDNTVLKPMKSDPDNPFGATIRQRDYIDKEGKSHQSPINIVNDDSDWGNWSKTLSSQMLSKQSPTLAKRQLDLTYRDKKQEFDDICRLTNPAVKKRLLESFADDCDSSAVHLKAAPLPRQRTHVILPITSLKDNEIYAPNYKNGEEVVLIRYPHEGIFQIPRLKVNNNNPEAKRLLGQATHAVGINANVAEHLSGADFDGDTVTVIPTKGQPIRNSSTLKGLENFDPKEHYRAYPGMPETGPKNGFHTQSEMGKISNLITDMTIKGAPPSEIARATRHSMCVIDAEKHNLDWRRSYEENGIAQLKEKYQGGKNRGASTLISMSKGDKRVPQRKEYRLTEKTIDAEGNKIYEETGATYINKKGKEVPYMEKTTKMAEVRDAHELSSGTRIENIYADHANKLKALANEARKEYVATPNLKYNPDAKKTYSKEVDSLNAKLNIALKNAPNERKAQLVADKIWESKVKDNPSLKTDRAEASKVKAQIIEATRIRAGTTPRDTRSIKITDKEWEAIQAGAITHTTLTKILKNADLDEVRQRATPRTTKRGMTPAAMSRARAMLAAGYPQSEVAEACGVSVTTLRNNDLL